MFIAEQLNFQNKVLNYINIDFLKIRAADFK